MYCQEIREEQKEKNCLWPETATVGRVMHTRLLNSGGQFDQPGNPFNDAILVLVRWGVPKLKVQCTLYMYVQKHARLPHGRGLHKQAFQSGIDDLHKDCLGSRRGKSRILAVAQVDRPGSFVRNHSCSILLFLLRYYL